MLRSPRCIHAVSLADTGVNSNVVISDIVKDNVADHDVGIDTGIRQRDCMNAALSLIHI